MNETLQSILDERLTSGDAVAWGVWHSSSRVLTQSHPDWFTPEQIEQALHHLVITANNLHQHRIQPMRLCWTFDRARVFLAIRPDDVCLGLFVKNRVSGNFDAVEQALEEFLAMPEI